MARYVADLQIIINGTALPAATLRDVQSVTVTDSMQMAGSFTIVMNTWSSQLLQITWADNPLFAVGASIQIMLGYVDQLSKVLVGNIVDLALEYSVDSAPTLTVTGYDLRHQLALSSNTDTFKNMLDSDVASEVIARNNLQSNVQPTTVIWTHTTQNNETDLAFLNRLAWRNMFELTVSDSVIQFLSITGPNTIIDLQMEKDLTNFSASFSSSDVVDQVNVSGNDSATDTDYLATAYVLKLPGTLPFDRIAAEPATITDVVYNTQSESQAVANAKAFDAGSDPLTGSGTAYGNPLLRAGLIVQISGIGQRFSGQYRLQSVTHTMTPEGGYMTNFSVKGVAQ